MSADPPPDPQAEQSAGAEPVETVPVDESYVATWQQLLQPAQPGSKWLVALLLVGTLVLFMKEPARRVELQAEEQRLREQIRKLSDRAERLQARIDNEFDIRFQGGQLVIHRKGR
jgi:hypothetical protein